MLHDRPSKKLFNSCYEENLIRIDENVVSYSPRVYNGIEDLAETVMNPINCNSSRIAVMTRDNCNYAITETVYV
jgi:hypothetical protein